MRLGIRCVAEESDHFGEISAMIPSFPEKDGPVTGASSAQLGDEPLQRLDPARHAPAQPDRLREAALGRPAIVLELSEAAATGVAERPPQDPREGLRSGDGFGATRADLARWPVGESSGWRGLISEAAQELGSGPGKPGRNARSARSDASPSNVRTNGLRVVA